MAGQAPQDQHGWVLEAVARYEAPLARYSGRLLRDADAGRDVVQHAFLRLCDESPQRLGEGVAQWLFTVCRNRATDVLRREGRLVGLDAEAAAGCVGSEPNPAQAAETGELAQRLAELVAGLPGSQREVLDLWCEGFRYREIAGITGRTASTVRVLVHRALKRLREHPLVRRLARDDPAGHENGKSDYTQTRLPTVK